LKGVAAALGENLEKCLESNLIPRDAYEAALNDDYDGFLKSRAEAVHQAVTHLAGWA